MLDGEHLAGARNAALHFVRDEHDAVLVADLAQRAQEFGRRHVESALALHRLDHDRRDGLRIHVAVKQAVQVGKCLLGGHAPVRQRKRGVEDLGGEWPETLLVRHDLAGERHGHERAPMEAAGKGDDRRALGVVAGDFHRILERLRTRREENRFLREISGRECIQAFRQAHVGLVGDDVETGVRECLSLLRDGGHDLWVPVSGIQNRDAGGKIDETPAVDVPNFRILRFDGVDSLGPNAVRHRRRLAGLEL
jgi:hypothetical protein